MNFRIQTLLKQPSSQAVIEIWGTLKPPPLLTISEWADRERILSPESSAEPGKWYNERAPYQVGIMDAFNDPVIHTVVGMFASQTGKTEAGIDNPVGYYIDQDPCPILVTQPTLEIAKAWSKDRLAPMLRDTPCLEKQVGYKTRISESTILHRVFHGGHITVAGANSAASLVGRPIRILLMDEIDRYPFSAGAEGDPC